MNRVPQLAIKSALIVSLLMIVFCLGITTGISGSLAAPDALSSADSAAAAAAQPLSQDAVGTHDSADAAVSQEMAAPEDASRLDWSTEECRVSENFPESIRQWCGLITHYADEYGLAPDLIAAVMWQESGGDALAYSHSGAVGLLQVMPRDGLAADFMCANGPCFAGRPTIAELQDPEFNVEYGVRMLSGLQSRLGSLREALKSYGPHDVGYYYADRILAIFEQYGEN